MRKIIFIAIVLLALTGIMFLVCLISDIILTYKKHLEITQIFGKLVSDDITSLQQELETYQQMLQAAKDYDDQSDDHPTENQPKPKNKPQDKPPSRV